MKAKSKPAGDYYMRIVLLSRVLGAQGDNGEVVETWPEPTSGGEYFAAPDSFTNGETIVQGLREGVGSMKLRIKGRAIPITRSDRIRKKHTGEVFNVTAVIPESADTVILCERYHPQTVGQ